MDPHARSSMNTQIYEEACAWFAQARGEDLDESGRREFDRWLRKSPEHLSAYLEIAAIWNEGPLLDPTNKWTADTLLQHALKSDDDNIVALRADFACREAAAAGPVSAACADDSRSGTAESASAVLVEASPTAVSGALPQETAARNGRRRARYRTGRKLAIAASVAALAIVGGIVMRVELSPPIYATALGEQRSIQLEDGSTVELNSRSKIRVSYSKQERDVELIEGQALFHAAHNASRPFIVAVGATRVRAVGTQFDIYKRTNATVVTVVEGRVAVYSAPSTSTTDLALPAPPAASRAPGAPSARTPKSTTPTAGSALPPEEPLTQLSSASFLVSAGEQLSVTPGVMQKIAHANVAGATAWREREIVFESATLSDVAEEFNRYNERQLVIAEDPKSPAFHVSGVFSSTDPDSLIRFLKQRPGVRVTETDAQIRVEPANP